MATMELSSPSEEKGQIFDEVRGIWTAATPEEKVRQKLIQKMLYGLSYPRELLAVEKSLSELCQNPMAPMRRVDLVCYALIQKKLTPILIVECKESSIESKAALQQLQGYNHYVKAPFIATASAQGEVFGYPSKEGYSFLPYLPKYEDLLKVFACG